MSSNKNNYENVASPLYTGFICFYELYFMVIASKHNLFHVDFPSVTQLGQVF